MAVVYQAEHRSEQIRPRKPSSTRLGRYVVASRRTEAYLRRHTLTNANYVEVRITRCIGAFFALAGQVPWSHRRSARHAMASSLYTR